MARDGGGRALALRSFLVLEHAVLFVVACRTFKCVLLLWRGVVVVCGGWEEGREGTTTSTDRPIAPKTNPTDHLPTFTITQSNKSIPMCRIFRARGVRGVYSATFKALRNLPGPCFGFLLWLLSGLLVCSHCSSDVVCVWHKGRWEITG